MQLHSDDRTIDTVRLFTTQIPVMDGLVLWAKISKVFAPALTRLRAVNEAQLASMLAKLGADAAQFDLVLAGDVVAVLGPSITALLEQLDATTLKPLTRDLLSSTIAIVDGGKFELNNETAINAAFGGNLWLMIKVMLWVGRFNFTSFFPRPSAAVVLASQGAEPAKAKP